MTETAATPGAAPAARLPERLRFRLDDDAVCAVDAAACGLDRAATTDGPGAIVLGLAKAGSTLLHQLVKRLCTRAGQAWLDIPAGLAAAGVEPKRARIDLDGASRAPGLVLTGLRWLPDWIEPATLAGRRTILMVRDPRDMVVSLYFSMAVSHAPPQGAPERAFQRRRARLEGVAIDDFAAGPVAASMFGKYCRVLAVTRGHDLRLHRYEDVVFDKPRFVAALGADLGLTPPDRVIERFAAQADERPAAERPEAHVRQVTPGDHRRKLTDDTIATLNETFAPILDAFGYAR